ncbi:MULTISPECIES: hypothetical protein [unclassified Nostoc]|nr:hypothetical protein [Nostoc sp. JL23]MBN3880052.1 hypothetical protein [Nostoc sp. JL23]
MVAVIQFEILMKQCGLLPKPEANANAECLVEKGISPHERLLNPFA